MSIAERIRCACCGRTMADSALFRVPRFYGAEATGHVDVLCEADRRALLVSRARSSLRRAARKVALAGERVAA